jgi:capsule polysaccharide export protein KpsE/RkpR
MRVLMADSKEVLTMMKEVAKSRIEMLRDGVTFHDASKREYYLKEYEKKLRDIEQLIRRLNLRLVYSSTGNPNND